jgi:hypothetical protein
MGLPTIKMIGKFDSLHLHNHVCKSLAVISTVRLYLFQYTAFYHIMYRICAVYIEEK